MKKDLKAPKYKIGEIIGYNYDNCENDYRVSRIAGIVHYDNEYKYLLDEDIISDTEINLEQLLSEDDIINIFKTIN